MEVLESKTVVLNVDNIDTDQIIPAAYLKSISRDGFGIHLFHNWRYDSEGNPKDDFILNNPKIKGAILVVGNNFGCGSSREHAAWAIAEYGFKVIISSQFADIFKGNALNNGILPIELSKVEMEVINSYLINRPNTVFEVDLRKQTVKIKCIHFKAKFAINSFKKACLMNGIDETQYLVNMRSEIKKFEQDKAC